MKKRHLFPVLYGLLVSSALPNSATAQSTRLDPSFQPPVILNAASSGRVNGVVRQADGKYVIGGAFTSINGVRARNLARLNANGTLDAAFTANCQVNGPIASVALQPDGSIMVGGQFDSLATAPRRAVGRLLPTGTLDATFNANLTLGGVGQIGLLPGGDVLISSPGSPSASPPIGLYRLNGRTGQPDPTFQSAVNALCFAVKPDGRIITGGGGTSYVLMYLLAQLLPPGALDPGFTHFTSYYYGRTEHIELDANGVIYRLGVVGSSVGGGLSNSNFSQNYALAYGASTFKLQPDNRIILGILKSTNGSSNANATLTDRLLPNGQLDPSYDPASGPRADANGQGLVSPILVQPDGAIVMGGTFTLAGTTPVHGLIRLLTDNVLAAKDSQAEKMTVAWPVPAATRLNIGFDAAARPRQVQLLDAVGRVVLARAVTAATTALTLEVAALPVGAYALRVEYEQAAPVTRRIVLGQ